MQTLKQSNIVPKRTFKSWFKELRQKAQSKSIPIELDENFAEMYYNGGYSPKMTIHEILRIPHNQDLF